MFCARDRPRPDGREERRAGAGTAGGLCRNHLRSLDETVQSVREVGIIIPIAGATVDAYLRNRSDRADELDYGAQYIVVDGHRRLEAARRVGMATIPVRVDNGRVATDEALLEAAFVANYHRDDMTDHGYAVPRA